MAEPTSRPYPPARFTTQQWAAVDPVQVDYRSLLFTQRGVYIAELLDPHHHRPGSDTIPHVVAWRHKLYLEDGHTRVVRALLAGHTHGPARVLDTPTNPGAMSG